MALNAQEKNVLKRELVDCLRTEKEIRKIVVFGSFLHTDNPHDLDVAVFQDSTEPYRPLALKYRQKTRSIARRIPLDIVPLKSWIADDLFLVEVAKRERLSMKDETGQWLRYAAENLQAARLLRDHSLLNSYLPKPSRPSRNF